MRRYQKGLAKPQRQTGDAWDHWTSALYNAKNEVHCNTKPFMKGLAQPGYQSPMDMDWPDDNHLYRPDHLIGIESGVFCSRCHGI